MFLKEKRSGHLVEVLNLPDLFDPFKTKISGRYHVGEELPEQGNFTKVGLTFLSDEELPLCWLDSHYRDHELAH